MILGTGSLGALALACLLDMLVGDPPQLPHPVRLLGRVIGALEKAARRRFTSPHALQMAGAVLVVSVAGGSALVVLVLLEGARRLHPGAEFALQVYIFFSMLAGGDLHRHVLRVLSFLQAGDLAGAREAVGLLVSRDTAHLHEADVARAALESLFENTADGLVAPLFYGALGGPALAVLYKAVNTMDSMIGYKTPAYLHLGRAAARADDLLCYLPARLTALFFLLAGAARGRAGVALRVLQRDRDKHESPNSAWPEAAAAGVLGLRLGGADRYGGMEHLRPVINAAGRDPRPKDLERALSLYRDTGLTAFCFIALLLSLWQIVGGMFR